MFEKAACVRNGSNARQLWKFSWLHKTQHPTMKTSKETVINLSGQTLDDGTYSLLQKGLNYAVTSRNKPIDILAVVEKAVQSLPVEMAEEARKETIGIIKSSSKHTDNLTRAEREALWNLQKNMDLSILPADEGNTTVILNTVDYKPKITSLLEDPSYRKLARDLLNRQNKKTTLLLKKFTLTEDISKQLQWSSSRPLRLYGLPKIYRDPLSATLALLPTNSPITWQDFSGTLPGIWHTR
jgi:hypothetical protein